ncbi:hypothetical protein V8B97DRAFT_1920908 [Scleroderma yunnanense]
MTTLDAYLWQVVDHTNKQGTPSAPVGKTGAIGEAVPVAGSVIKVIVGGLLHVLQIMNQYNKNKVDLESLVKKIEQTMLDVDTFPCIQMLAQVKHQETFVQGMQKRLGPLDLWSEWLMPEIDGYTKEMNFYLSHYLCQAKGTIHLDSKLDKVLTIQLLLFNPKYPTAYAGFLNKCMKAGRFDLCIETGIGVKELTSEDNMGSQYHHCDESHIQGTYKSYT